MTRYSGDMIERIKLSSLRDTHFAVVDGMRMVRNKKHATLFRESWRGRNGQVEHRAIVQCRDYAALKELQFAYPDEIGSPAQSMIERVLPEIVFGLGDVRPGARHMILETATHGSAARLASWMKKNCISDVVMLEGPKLVRVSFESDEDYLLARLNFI